MAEGMDSGSSTTATLPVSQQTATAQVSTAQAPLETQSIKPTFMDIVPETHREKQWVQDTAKAENPFEALFKRFDGQEELIGKKSTGLVIPPDDAPLEQLKEFHKAIGVPETPDAYGYSPPDISKEPEQIRNILAERAKDQTFLKEMAIEAHKLGVPAKVFNALATKFDGWEINRIKGALERQAQSQTQIKEQEMKMLKDVYGDKADKVSQTVKDVIEKLVPEGIRKMGNANMNAIELARVVHEKLFANDKISSGTPGSPSVSPEAIHTKIMQLRATDEFKNFQHPGHEGMRQQVEQLYTEYMAAKNKPV